MDIKVLGVGCPRCTETEKRIRNVLAEMDIAANLEKLTDIKLFASMGVLQTPGVVIDGEVKSQGKIPSKEEIRNWLEAKE